MKSVIEEIAAERKRQIEVEGWSTEHDDMHPDGELARAGGCYAYFSGSGVDPRTYNHPGYMWPWDWKWWKPTNPRRNLIKAAALIVAEIERIDRSAQQEGDGDDSLSTRIGE